MLENLFPSVWQIPDGDAEETSSHGARRLELSFEYLVAKNTLKWVTLYSSQVIQFHSCYICQRKDPSGLSLIPPQL